MLLLLLNVERKQYHWTGFTTLDNTLTASRTEKKHTSDVERLGPLTSMPWSHSSSVSPIPPGYHLQTDRRYSRRRSTTPRRTQGTTTSGYPPRHQSSSSTETTSFSTKISGETSMCTSISRSLSTSNHVWLGKELQGATWLPESNRRWKRAK